ncbi:MAG TPA: DHH family phosphoesterase [Patescibacteria group bacterium]|nr:DHH family phosphoesterase [Patescibacteria group bacterium]
MKSLQFQAVRELVDVAQHILLLTDERSDGDTFGSSLGFSEYLQGLGKKVSHHAGSEVMEMLKFLPGIENATRDTDVLKDSTVDLVIVFDSSRESYVNRKLEFHLRRTPLIVFDHHASNSGFGDVSIVDPSLSSTCELVYEYLMDSKIKITRDMAKCLITGIMTDTRVLSNAVTQSGSVERASELLMAGGSIKDVVTKIVKSYPVSRLQLWGRIFERTVKIPDLSLAVVYVTRADLDSTSTGHEDYFEVMDYLAATLDVEVVMFLKELPNKEGVKVSMRSHTIDVSQIAKQFPGGGGHPGSCGFTVKGRIEKKGNKVLIK